MHGAKGRLPGWAVHRKEVIRLAAYSAKEAWVYQFPPEEWADAVRRIMADTRKGKLPDEAAGGMLEMIAEGVEDDC